MSNSHTPVVFSKSNGVFIARDGDTVIGNRITVHYRGTESGTLTVVGNHNILVKDKQVIGRLIIRGDFNEIGIKAHYMSVVGDNNFSSEDGGAGTAYQSGIGNDLKALAWVVVEADEEPKAAKSVQLYPLAAKKTMTYTGVKNASSDISAAKKKPKSYSGVSIGSSTAASCSQNFSGAVIQNSQFGPGSTMTTINHSSSPGSSSYTTIDGLDNMHFAPGSLTHTQFSSAPGAVSHQYFSDPIDGMQFGPGSSKTVYTSSTLLPIYGKIASGASIPPTYASNSSIVSGRFNSAHSYSPVVQQTQNFAGATIVNSTFDSHVTGSGSQRAYGVAKGFQGDSAPQGFQGHVSAHSKREPKTLSTSDVAKSKSGCSTDYAVSPKVAILEQSKEATKFSNLTSLKPEDEVVAPPGTDDQDICISCATNMRQYLFTQCGCISLCIACTHKWIDKCEATHPGSTTLRCPNCDTLSSRLLATKYIRKI